MPKRSRSKPLTSALEAAFETPNPNNQLFHTEETAPRDWITRPKRASSWMGREKKLLMEGLGLRGQRELLLGWAGREAS
jgi:hypothetical protein